MDLTKGLNESEIDYVQRMCSAKDSNNLTWKALTELLNKNLGQNYSESYYRKNFKLGNFVTTNAVESTTRTSSICETEVIYSTLTSSTEENQLEYNSLDNLLFKIKKERVKLSDERSQNSAYVRRLSREDTIKEIAHDYAEIMSAKKKLPTSDINQDLFTVNDSDGSLKEGILLLSDWHYGMICDNPWNKFDPEICRYRVRKLLDKVIQIVHDQDITSVTVLNLSDLIAGRIHTQIRIESRFDVITQTMEVAEILAEFLSELSLHCVVDYYDCLDNHSRVEPNKNDSVDLESLVRIIPWYLRERFKGIRTIDIHDNEFGAEIITCQVMGHNIIGVHGDNDRPTTALERLSLMTHKHYDMLCTAHLHHFSADEQHQSVVVSNSSLMGVDRYAEKLRLTSDPSQTFIIATTENVCECIYRIVLK